MQTEIFVGKVGICNLQKTNLDYKGPETKHFITPQMQKYLTQGGMKTPKIYLWI